METHFAYCDTLKDRLAIIQGQIVVVFRDQTNRAFWDVIARHMGRLKVVKRTNLLVLKDCVFHVDPVLKRYRQGTYHAYVKGVDTSDELRDFGEGRSVRYWPTHDRSFVYKDNLSRIDAARYVIFDQREVIAIGGVSKCL